MKNTFKQVMCSLLALVMTLSAFIGTTFAWFTDTVTSSGNIIETGKLKAKMEWSEDLSTWTDASSGPVFNYNNWEPGYTEVKYVKVSNDGTLNLRWKLSIEAEGTVSELADVIDVYCITLPDDRTTVYTKDEVLSGTRLGTLTEILESKDTASGDVLTPGKSAVIMLAFHMDELEGNDSQEMSLCDAGFALKLLATQAIGEYDSFGND